MRQISIFLTLLSIPNFCSAEIQSLADAQRVYSELRALQERATPILRAFAANTLGHLPLNFVRKMLGIPQIPFLKAQPKPWRTLINPVTEEITDPQKVEKNKLAAQVKKLGVNALDLRTYCKNHPNTDTQLEIPQGFFSSINLLISTIGNNTNALRLANFIPTSDCRQRAHQSSTSLGTEEGFLQELPEEWEACFLQEFIARATKIQADLNSDKPQILSREQLSVIFDTEIPNAVTGPTLFKLINAHLKYFTRQFAQYEKLDIQTVKISGTQWNLKQVAKTIVWVINCSEFYAALKAQGAGLSAPFQKYLIEQNQSEAMTDDNDGIVLLP